MIAGKRQTITVIQNNVQVVLEGCTPNWTLVAESPYAPPDSDDNSTLPVLSKPFLISESLFPLDDVESPVEDTTVEPPSEPVDDEDESVSLVVEMLLVSDEEDD
jgi:hypothetical protein